jgi:hypothetical protein
VKLWEVVGREDRPYGSYSVLTIVCTVYNCICARDPLCICVNEAVGRRKSEDFWSFLQVGFLILSAQCAYQELSHIVAATLSHV